MTLEWRNSIPGVVTRPSAHPWIRACNYPCFHLTLGPTSAAITSFLYSREGLDLLHLRRVLHIPEQPQQAPEDAHWPNDLSSVPPGVLSHVPAAEASEGPAWSRPRDGGCFNQTWSRRRPGDGGRFDQTRRRWCLSDDGRYG